LRGVDFLGVTCVVDRNKVQILQQQRNKVAKLTHFSPTSTILSLGNKQETYTAGKEMP